jgi:hypothetical protein
MGYPQPDADRYSTGGAGFFRLKTTLTSDGDMYESAQGTHGLAIGPDSDISKVNVAYFDPQQEQQQSIVSISPDRPFPGFIQAANESGLYIPSNRPGRILIWPDELWFPEYGPPDYNIGGEVDRLDTERPILDVVEYFSPVGATPGRTDKIYLLETIPWVATGHSFFWVLPFYGRHYAVVTFRNITGNDISITCTGVNFGYNFDARQTETTLIATTVVASNTSFEDEILGSTDGMFDALAFELTHALVLPANPGVLSRLKIRVSDREA